MDFGQAIKSCFQKYAEFEGRSPRSEYWYFTLFVALARFLAKLLDIAIAHSSLLRDGLIEVLFFLVVLLPHLSVLVRRLHDINLSGWWAAGFIATTSVAAVFMILSNDFLGRLGLLAFLLVSAILLICLTLKGTDGQNRFGPDPLKHETSGNNAT